MDKDTRNAIERATQRARNLLEEDFAAQLEGDFDVQRSGAVAAKAGGHLTARQAFQRERILAAIEHKRAAGMSASGAVADYLRDAAFTALNRFVALKMLEARELVQECITKGEQSAGYREFCGMAQGLALLPDSAGYRLYIESLFDELSTEIKVLFDRRDPASVLWPKRATFEQLLEALNGRELAGAWGEDETVGWVYQFFNGQDERRKMREESQAPRDSRELAVRNQFFTPRYVVQFLTDNTLGRVWYEMRGTKTALAERCEYMLRKAGEELAPRVKKDPRDLRVLDPACGSGHFLLYAFDLLLAIYEEAYADPDGPKSEATGKTLAEDYPTREGLCRAVPGLVLEYNLHGVDIDPRCAQIAQLALWMRAQRAYRDLAIPRLERAKIERSNIVIAEPLVADDQLLTDFVAQLGDPHLGTMFTDLVRELSLAADFGLLLPLEQSLRRQSISQRTGPLFRPSAEAIRETLGRFVSDDFGRVMVRRQLFVNDAAQGVGLLTIAERTFDVVLMNPPFGEFIPTLFAKLAALYPDSKRDLGIAFIERGISLLANGGLIGALVSRKPFFVDTQSDWRARFPGHRSFVAFADLGHKVLDNALVEVAAVAIRAADGTSHFIDCLAAENKQAALHAAVSEASTALIKSRSLSDFAALPSLQFAYGVDSRLLETFRSTPSYEPLSGKVRMGLTTSDNDRFVRLWWEIPKGKSDRWVPIVKGGEYAPYFAGFELMVKWEHGRGEMAAYNLSVGNEAQSRRGHGSYFKPALTYTERTASRFSARLLPAGAIFTGAGPAILPSSPDSLLQHLAVFSSWYFGALYEVCLGGGDAVSSGAAARHYTSGLLGRMPFPEDLSALSLVQSEIEGVLKSAISGCEMDRSSPYARPTLNVSWASVSEAAESETARRALAAARTIELSGRIEEAVTKAYGLSTVDVRLPVAAILGPHPDWLPSTCTDDLRATLAERVRVLYALDMDALVDRATELLGNARHLTLKSFCADRRLELVSHVLNIHPRLVACVVREERIVAAGALNDVVENTVEYVFESLWLGDQREGLAGELATRDIAFDSSHIETLWRSQECLQDRIYVDDEGHRDDIVAAFCGELERITSPQFASSLTNEIGGVAGDMRHFIARQVFAQHLRRRSLHRRSAPMLWQLATRSGSYSVWLYIHAFNRDTLFRVQNDYVVPKLAHEERRLESLTSELRDGATAAQRRALAAQESIVEELRAFLEEVKRVAPLWNPNLDDGVIINFAPLWRLVPQNKPWQKELKTTWDALCNGDYDWAHLAMHFWPERVVPKCSKDRSLAIAHGLEEVFWVEEANGKWTARKMPTCSIEQLVRERSSPAVKSALKSLLEGPVATGSGGRGRGGRRGAMAGAVGGDA